jgi:hypothetical protein
MAAGLAAGSWVTMDLATATPVQLLAGAVGSLTGAIVFLWRKLDETRKELSECQEKYEEQLKQSAKDYERFAQELARRRSRSSDPPPR